MELVDTGAGFSVALFAVAVAGGVLPLVRQWSDRALHLFVTFSCGVFLGAVFLHLLPEVGEVAQESHSPIWPFVLLGVVGVYIVSALFVREAHHADEQHQHAMVSYAALFGLCVHSLTAGLGLAATLRHDEMAWPLMWSLLLHKGAESFSLVTVFLLAHFGRRRVVGLMCAFALITPAGILFGTYLMSQVGAGTTHILVALAAGTFLYVALCELLPEVFHHPVDRLPKVLLLMAGIGFIYFAQYSLGTPDHSAHALTPLP